MSWLGWVCAIVPAVAQEDSSSSAAPADGDAQAGPASDSQLLSSEQLAAVVLIEGDEGVGSGFVARIRDLNFVVTNLHVIGGNSSIRVTTIGGVAVPVGAMFGAAGRDVAIMRVEGDYAGATLTLSEDPVRSAKLGDQIAVVGNRRGGGVATQVAGVVQGIGPDRIEVNARFQSGNSGSPIVHMPTGEVIGVASYSQTQKLDEIEGKAGKTGGVVGERVEREEERWFGFRVDGIARWETIDLARWRVQAKKIADFEADSQAIHHALNGRLNLAAQSPRVQPVVSRFVDRYERLGGVRAEAAKEVQEFFHGLRALANNGVTELRTGDYYDFFRTNEYWETSITLQLRARADLARQLDEAAHNSALFLSRLRR